MKLWCAICLHEDRQARVINMTPKPVVTIVNGQAVCMDHFDQVSMKVDTSGGQVAIRYINSDRFNGPQ